MDRDPMHINQGIVFMTRFVVRGLWFAVMFVALSGSCWAWTAKVVGISDGDTLTVLRSGREQVKIRLYGIDAPESDQPHGQASRKHLSSLVFGKNVDVLVVSTDRYGRTVARIHVKGRDVNAAQIQDGYAWLYRAYCKTRICTAWAVLESRARADRKGLWADDEPVAPWKWRKAGKKARSWIDDLIELERLARRILRLISSW